MPVALSQSLSQQLLQRIPQVAQMSLRFVPFQLKAKAIKEMLAIILKEQMEDDELGFLNGKWVAIVVSDFNFAFEVSFNDEWLVREPQGADVTFSADSKALIKVAANVEDPDTLFFQRQLFIEGDTELGLEVKNLFLSIEMDLLPSKMSKVVKQLSVIVEGLENRAKIA
ncbi:MAG: ubiquinone anaerobic biosynthesis accessory factor UbiT [Parashewanella sp.]